MCHCIFNVFCVGLFNMFTWNFRKGIRVDRRKRRKHGKDIRKS